MKKARKITLLTGVFFWGVSLWLSVPAEIQAEAMPGHAKHAAKKATQEDVNGLETTHAHHLPALTVLLEKAAAAVKAGDDKAALAHLQTAQSMLERVKEAVGKAVGPVFANTKCPMMGGVIQPEKVMPALTREFNGQKVAFCCGGCPDMWDKLSEPQKQAKLATVKATAPSGH